MKLSIPYGNAYLHAELSDDWQIERIEPYETIAAVNPLETVAQAIEKPIGEYRLEDFREARTVAIAINDKTRRVPNEYLLPPLLAKLAGMGFAPQNISLMIATGTHVAMSPEEYPLILPREIIKRYPIYSHDCYDENNLTYLGDTPRGTPVYTNSRYLAADLRIVVGNIEPHQFIGFSGGTKSAAIGLAGKKTIDHNHAMMMHEEAKLGAYERNPARQDIEDIGRMIGVHFAHNALLNGKKEIVECLFGEPAAVMQNAIPRVRDIYQVPVGKLFDLLIVSPGGSPKDINLYQGQKALGHASLVMKDGGTVILAAACPEGTGSRSYEAWITDGKKNSHEDVFAHFKEEGFRIGPHKAYQISRDASRFRVMFISEMPDDFVRQLLLEPMPDLQTALDLALVDLPSDAHIGIIPYANSTIPSLHP
jgi:nickel-dependent lactate racemase